MQQKKEIIIIVIIIILILLDFSIQTDHVIEAWWPDLVLVDKDRICKIIDFAVPGDGRIEEKEKDKIEKY